MTQRTNYKILTNLFALLCCVPLAILQDQETERLTSELQLDDLELIDTCEYLAFTRKESITKQLYDETVEQQKRFGEIVKTHYDQLRTFTDVPIELERNWTYQVKPGDALLPEDKWDKLITYENHIQELISQAKLCSENETDLCLTGITDYNNALNNRRTHDTLKSTWKSWQAIYNDTDVSDFRDQLGLIKEAATLNEFDSVQDYWEALLDFSGGYEQADAFWENVSPFYKKLHSFVQKRLFKFYGLESEAEVIPAYLLGGQFGTDWSNIADIILPHPQLHFDAASYLKYKNIEDIYRYAENITKNLGLGPLGADFWKNSLFNTSICGPQLLEFCDQSYTQLITCNKTSWSIYLDAQEIALKVSLNNLDYSSIPRQNLRYNAIDDAVQKLGSLLAIESLDYHGIVDTNNTNQSDDDPAQMTKLLLTALRLMPRLAYSFMTDKWRMAAIEQNTTNITGDWWQYRKDYMGVVGVENNEPEYLGDSRIISNRPYMNQFFGTLVAFQLFMYYKERSGGQHVINQFEKEEFVTLLRSRHTTEWPFLLTNQYGLDIGTDGLLSYFAPLEQYFNTAPTEQVTIITTTTTTTEAPTTKAYIITTDNYVVNDEPKANVSQNLRVLDAKSIQVADSHVAMYVGIAGLVAIACALVVGLVYKKFRRRSRTNNRRFDA